MPAKSKKKSTVKRKRTSSSQGLIGSYVRQRDEFYQTHPRGRVLLGLLIVSFALAIGVLYYNKTLVYIGLTLDAQYGIRYPVVERGFVEKR